MLKWLLLAFLVGFAYGTPGVYDEYTYSEEKEGEDGMYLYYDEDDSEEEDITDEELKKITDAIANTSDEDEKPQRGGRGMKKNKRPKRSPEDEEVAEEDDKAVDKTVRFSLRPDKIILPIIKEIFNQHPKPLTKEQRDKISGGFFGWQYAMQDEDCCSCNDNTCSCCPSTNITGSACVKFAAEPNRVQVSIDIGTHRHSEITVAKNSRSMSCEHANLKDICMYSYSFTTSNNGYKACVIITNNVKDPKAGVLKCITYADGKSSLSDD